MSTVAGEAPRRVLSRERTVGALSILVPAVVAAVLTGYDLSVRSLWLDESATVAITSQHGAALWAAMRHDGGNMLAYYALMHVLISLFGHSLVVFRLPSVVATAVTAGTVSAVGTRLFDRRVGVAAGLLTAVNLPLVYWGQDARGYALMYAFSALSWLAFVALVDGESSRRPGKPPAWAWPLYAVALVLATYMSFVALLVVPAQLISLLWYRRRLRQIVSALIVMALCSLPLLVLAHERGAGQLFWIPRPSLRYAGEIVKVMLGSGMPPQFAETASSLPLLVVTMVILIAVGLAAVKNLAAKPDAGAGAGVIARERWVAALVVSWLVVPTLLDTAESVVGQSLFENRYLLASVPAVSLAVAWGLLSARWPSWPPWPRWQRLPGWTGWLAVAALVALRTLQIAPSYGVSPENWQGVANYVLDHARPGDCIAFYPSDGRQALDYYFESADRARGAGPLPHPVLPSAPFADVKPYVEDYQTLSAGELAHVDASCRRLWFVSSHVGQPHGSASSTAHYVTYKALLASLLQYFPHRTRVVFGHAAEVNVWLFTAPLTGG